MGRTKDLREDIPFSPGSFGSMEQFADAIGWNLGEPAPQEPITSNPLFMEFVDDLATQLTEVVHGVDCWAENSHGTFFLTDEAQDTYISVYEELESKTLHFLQDLDEQVKSNKKARR
tara:strand:+ start:75 stop:425 length:351 start_codon:yes stop_codon:yes gene_type:complete